MSRIGLLTVFVAAALVTPVAAVAKGPDRAAVCGADRCATLRGATVPALIDWGGRSGFEQLPAPRRAPFYRITLYDHGRQAWKLVYAPSVGRVRITQLDVYPFGTVTPYWRRITPAGVTAMSRAIRGIEPYPAPSSWH